MLTWHILLLSNVRDLSIISPKHFFGGFLLQHKINACKFFPSSFLFIRLTYRFCGEYYVHSVNLYTFDLCLNLITCFSEIFYNFFKVLSQYGKFFFSFFLRTICFSSLILKFPKLDCVLFFCVCLVY